MNELKCNALKEAGNVHKNFEKKTQKIRKFWKYPECFQNLLKTPQKV